MNRQRLVLATTFAAGLFVLGPDRTAQASYQGLQVQLHTVVIAGGAPRSVYRVYATFDDSGDFLQYVAGSPTGGNMVVLTLSSAGVSPGGNFWNAPGGHISAPTFAEIAITPDIEWDTFVTIGVASVPDINADATGLFPGWTGIGNVPEVNTDYAGWFTAGPQPQGMAGNGVLLPDGLWGVLAMQLTVNVGNHVRGRVLLGGVNANPLAGGSTFYATNQTFNSFPAPATGLVLALAGIGSSQRRREGSR
jgi:hypothetical protein